jgi:hypothetical protein
MSHIEAHKQVVAQNIMNPPEASAEDEVIQTEVST